MESISIVVVGNVPPAEIEILRSELEKIFSYEFQVYSRIRLPEECYLERSGQYDAACILNKLHRFPGFRVLGIVSGDITFSGHNFLLGLAASGGRAALISVHRLRHGDPTRYFDRVKKEAMHELGHTFGLKHCRNECVMRFSNTVFDVDNKPARFCDECSLVIREHLRWEYEP